MKKILPVFIIIICSISAVLFYSNNDESSEFSLTANNLSTVSVISNEPSTTTSDLSILIGILDLNDLRKRDDRLTQYFSQRMQSKPLNALSVIDQLQSNYDRQLSYQFAMLAWAEIDLSSFTSWLSNQSPNLNIDLGLVALSENSPANKLTAEYANKISDSSLRESTLENVFSAWVTSEPESAIAWTQTLTHDSSKLLIIAFNILMRDTPSQAIAALATLSDFGAEKINLAIGAIVSSFTIDHLVEEIFTALESLNPDTIREKLVTELVAALFNNNGAELEQLDSLIATLAPSDVKEELQYLLALNFADLDPKLTAQYAESLSGEALEATVTAVVRSWSETDLEATHKWLESLDTKIDPASESMARRSASQGQIEYSDYWLDNIEDESLRTQAATDLVNSWLDNDLGFGIQKLVYQDSISIQDKLSMLHQRFPDEYFRTPEDALERLDDLLRKSGYY